MSDAWPEGSIILYDSPNYIRNVDGNQMAFRKVSWCTTHDSNGQGSTRLGMACHLSGLYQATTPSNPGACAFTDKLIQI